MTDLETLQAALESDPKDRVTELALADLLEETGARIESIARLRLPKLEAIQVGDWEIYRYQSYPHDGSPGFSVRQVTEEGWSTTTYFDWIERRQCWTYGHYSSDSKALECPQEALAALAKALSQVSE